ncbi:MAG: hypothetical protein R3Y58_12255 [Eubacteriales bacterium]
MDLLFKRYASPYLLLDQVISTCGFSDFINQFVEAVDEDKYWEFYLHKLHPEDNRTFDDFKKDVKKGIGKERNATKSKNMSNKDIETTIQNSMKITMNFSPRDKEVKE